MQRLECPMSNSTNIAVDSANGITQTLLVILIIMVSALLIGLFYGNRAKIRANVKPLIDKFNRSLQYQTIEKDMAEHKATLEENV